MPVGQDGHRGADLDRAGDPGQVSQAHERIVKWRGILRLHVRCDGYMIRDHGKSESQFLRPERATSERLTLRMRAEVRNVDAESHVEVFTTGVRSATAGSGGKSVNGS